MLGLGTDPAEVARVLLEGEPTVVDVIDAGRRIVLGSVYAGVDSLASEIVDRVTRLPRSVHYPYAAVRSLLQFSPTRFTVEVDGRRTEERAYMVVVANSGYYGAGCTSPPTRPSTTGCSTWSSCGPPPRLRLIRSMPRLYDGSHVELDDVLVMRGRQVAVTSGAPVTAYGDGERLAPLPVTATVQPAALTVLV